MNMNKTTCIIIASFIIMFLSGYCYATPEYAQSTGQSCTTCHTSEYGGELTVAGKAYLSSGYVYPPPSKKYEAITQINKPLRSLIGFIHIMAGFLWFGTILYVHLLLKPAYAEKGLPKEEVRLGMVSMILVGITGIILTLSRVSSLDVLITTEWGIVLLVKISMYTLMVSSAILMVTYVGPRLRPQNRIEEKPEDGIYDKETLAYFNGTKGRECFFAYDGKVYDVTTSDLWKDGKHMKHPAGFDLTRALKKAPHGIDQIEMFHVVGTFDSNKKHKKNIHQKIFYFVAYMNLILVFLILLTISYWRWGI